MNTKMDSKQKITAKDCIHLANDIIVERNLMIPRLTSIKDIDHSFLVLTIEDIFCIDFSQIVLSLQPKTKSQEIALIDRLLSFISEDLFLVALDHIRAKDIVERNLTSIYNLLEIVSTFVKYIPKKFVKTNSLSTELKSNTKAVQTNGLDTERKSRSKQTAAKDLKTEDLIQSLSELEFQNLLKSESTSSPVTTIPSTSVSEQPIRPTRQSLRRELHSCGDCEESNPKQESVKRSKAIQTEIETQLTPKSVEFSKEKSFDEYKRWKCENFATLLGHRLHETLKLKELTDSIEYRIKRYYGDVTTQTPKRVGSKSVSKWKSTRKQSIRSKRSPQMKRTISPLKSKSKLRQSIRTTSLDELIQTFPEISRNTIKSLKEQERHQKKVIENLNKDIFVKELKVKSKMDVAIETQQKRSKLIHNDIRHLEALAETKGSKMERIKENAEKRDSRIERARMAKMIERLQNELSSKYKRLQSIEENIVVKEYEKRHKEHRESINDFRKRIQEKHGLEMERQKKMLDAFEALYQQKYDLLNENLKEEEKRLKTQISDQSHYLRSMKRDLNYRFEKDFQNIFNK